MTEAISIGLDEERLRRIPTAQQAGVPDPRLLTNQQCAVVAATTRTYKLTEYGNAQRLAVLFGEDVRWVPEEKLWYVWRGTHWSPDVDGELMRRAKTVARVLWHEVPLVDAIERPFWIRHAQQSEKKRALQAMIDLAASEKVIRENGESFTLTCSADDFDRDTDLLNCPNGTLSLITGELAPHRRQDLHRRIAAAPYDPECRSAEWERFLADSTGGDEELVRYLQLLAGATLLGTNRYDLVPIIFGPPGTGKSTFIRALLAPLGARYGATASLETFAERRATSSARDDLARLEGLRMVACIEGERNHILAVGLLKQISGGDEVAARRLYQCTRTWRPEMTAWIAVNERPRIPHDEEGIWRRAKAIPFENQVPVMDTTLRDRLSDPVLTGPAVLAWAVRGALRLAATRGPIVAPACVVEATEEYREEQAPSGLDAWLNDRCRLAEPEARTPVDELRASYEDWCATTGAPVMNTKPWGSAMGRLFKRARNSTTRFYQGVVVTQQEPVDDGSEVEPCSA